MNNLLLLGLLVSLSGMDQKKKPTLQEVQQKVYNTLSDNDKKKHDIKKSLIKLQMKHALDPRIYPVREF